LLIIAYPIGMISSSPMLSARSSGTATCAKSHERTRENALRTSSISLRQGYGDAGKCAEESHREQR
jgi:hypothetical protein